jgi:hypothetical protein
MDGFVIMRSIGEYSDRSEQSIRFVATEDEAKALVLRATNESKMGYISPEWPKPKPPFEKFQTATPSQRVQWAAILLETERAIAQKIRDAGFVDSFGPDIDATYSYERVWTYTPRDDEWPRDGVNRGVHQAM